MNYINYFIKCVIRKFVNLIFKPKMFLLLLVIGFVFSALLCNTTFAAEGQPVINPSITSDLIINGSNIVTFGGFKVYYFKVFEGQTFSYQFTTSTAAEVRYCYTREVPKNGTAVYSGSYGQSNRDTGYTSPEVLMTSPVNGYFVFEVYPQNGLATVTFWDNSSTSDAINNQTSIITSNQDKNTQDIIDNNDANTDKIIESNNKINNALTNSTVNDSSISVNTSDFVVDSEETVALDNFFTSFMNTIKDIFTNIDTTVEEIEIGIPFTRSINYFTK